MLFTNISSPLYLLYTVTLWVSPFFHCFCVPVVWMIVGCRACCTPGPIIFFWQPHYSSEEKMNATYQRTVNCVSGCVVGLGTGHWIPLQSVQPTQAFPGDCVLEDVMAERRKEKCEKDTNGWKKWAVREREKSVRMWLFKVCLAKMWTIVVVHSSYVI